MGSPMNNDSAKKWHQRGLHVRKNVLWYKPYAHAVYSNCCVDDRELSLTRRHRNDRLPGRPRAAAPEPRVKAGPRLEQVLAAGVAQRLQVRHEAEVGQREVRTGQVAEPRGGEVRVEHVERGRRAW